ncbi:MAG: glycosyltransferase family 87 protein [Planctomycetota bacterium]
MVEKSPSRVLGLGRAALLVWMLGAVLPYALSNPVNVDFGQLYMAGALAAEGSWDALYATPLPDAILNPAYPEASTPHPEYLRLAEARGVPAEACRFIYPPPVALAVMPLGWLSYDTARFVFAAVCCLALWFTGIQAGYVYRHFRGRAEPWVELLLAALVCLSPAMINGMRSLNVSMFTCAVVGVAVLTLLRRQELSAAGAFALGGVVKATSGPLVVVAAFLGRWKAVATTAAITVAVVTASLVVMGNGPFERFFGDIAPRLTVSDPAASNQSLAALLLRLRLTEADGPLLSGVRYAGVVLLLGLAWIARRQTRRDHARYDQHLIAGLYAAMLAWMVFNPLFWSHYQIVLTPFWGWLAWEWRRQLACGRWLLAVGLAVCFVSVWFPATIPLSQRFDTPELVTSHGLWGTLGLLAYAVGRLLGLGWLGFASDDNEALPDKPSEAAACP